MKTNFLLLLAILFFSCSYANSRILLYKNDGLEVNKVVRTVQKIYNNTIYDVNVEIGFDINGQITSYVLGLNDENSDYYKALEQNKVKLSGVVKDFISNLMIKSLPENSYSCLSRCSEKWECYRKPSEAGVLLCVQDCFIECYML